MKLVSILAILVGVIVLSVAVFVGGNQRQEPLQPSPTLPPPQTQEPRVTPKTEYKNPFDKNVQYINPFSEYKNPFDQ